MRRSRPAIKVLYTVYVVFSLKAFQRCRTTFFIMNLLALIGYAGYPLMPPRLVNDCEVRPDTTCPKHGRQLEDYTFCI